MHFLLTVKGVRQARGQVATDEPRSKRTGIGCQKKCGRVRRGNDEGGSPELAPDFFKVLDRVSLGSLVDVPHKPPPAIFGEEAGRPWILVDNVNWDTQPSQATGNSEPAVLSASQDQ